MANLRKSFGRYQGRAQTLLSICNRRRASVICGFSIFIFGDEGDEGGFTSFMPEDEKLRLNWCSVLSVLTAVKIKSKSSMTT